MEVEDQPAPVGEQLLLNLQSLGFCPSELVQSRLPRGVQAPRRYLTLQTEVAGGLSTMSSGMAEAVLYFLLHDRLPWPAVIAALQCSAPAEQRVRQQLLERAEEQQRSLADAFPCTEPGHVSGFKRAAAELLECCRHLIPRDVGNAKRLLSDAGPRLAWVCLRLSTVVLQHEVSGGLDTAPFADGEPIDRARTNVARAKVIASTLKWRRVAREWAAVEEAASKAAASMARTVAEASALQRDADTDAVQVGGESPNREAVRQAAEARASVAAAAVELRGAQDAVCELLQAETPPRVDRAAVAEAWAESAPAGGGRPFASVLRDPDDAESAVDLAALASSAAGALRAAAASAVAAGTERGVTSAVAAACERQLPVLQGLLRELRARNDRAERVLCPELQKEVGNLRRQLAAHPDWKQTRALYSAADDAERLSPPRPRAAAAPLSPGSGSGSPARSAAPLPQLEVPLPHPSHRPLSSFV